MKTKAYFLFALILLFSCNKDEIDTQTQTSTDNNNMESIKNNPYYMFSEILANSLENLNIRNFIKQEALKKISGDYDILFHLVKDSPIAESGKSFAELLQTYNPFDTSLEQITEDLPFLNIRVPHLTLCHPEDWDTELLTPLVACDIEIEKNSKLKVFSKDTDLLYLDSFLEPLETTIVVGKNNRVTNISTLKSKSVNELSYNFIKTTLIDINDLMNTDTENQLKSGSDRYSIYYSPNSELNHNIRERIKGIRFNSSNNFTAATQGMHGYDNKVLSSWHESMVTIQINVIYGGESSTIFNNDVVFIDFPSALWRASAHDNAESFANSFNYGSLPSFVTRSVKDAVRKYYTQQSDFFKSKTGGHYIPVDNVNFICWSLPRYGDRIKLIFNRWGSGDVKTKNESHNTKFSLSSVLKLEKLKFKDPFNMGAEWSQSGSTQIVSTDKSIELGSIIIDYEENYNQPFSVGRVSFIMKPE